MAIEKINTEALSYSDGNTIVGQEDVPGLSSEEMQMSMESLGRNAIIPKVNELVDAVNDRYTKAETDAAIDEKVVEIGAGDMAKAVYDPEHTIQNAGGIPAAISAAVSAAVAVETGRAEAEEESIKTAIQSVTCTLTAAGWAGDAAPYTQTVNVEGMTAEWIPGLAVCEHEDSETLSVETIIAESEALNLFPFKQAGNGILTFVCPDEKPTIDLVVTVSGVM